MISLASGTEATKVVISDWDETITVGDTIGILGELPYRLDLTIEPKFDYFTKVYLDAYEDYVKNFGSITDLGDEIAFQKGLHAVEMTSIKEIERLQLFSGITKAQFETCSQYITLKPGFIEFAKKCNQENIPLIILSINWTHLFIEKVLQENNISATILTNEFEFVDEVSTGRWDKTISIRTGIDKLNQIRLIKQLYNNASIIYIGDSSTDLLSLLDADIGIIIDTASVIKKLNQLKISILPDFANTLNSEIRNASKPNLLQTNWNGIHDLFFDS